MGDDTDMAGLTYDAHRYLRAWRKAHGLTLEQLANRIGSKANTLSGWETGTRTLDLEDLQRLAAAYEVHPAALLFAPPGGPKFENLRLASEILEHVDPEVAREWLSVGTRLAKLPETSFAKREKSD